MMIKRAPICCVFTCYVTYQTVSDDRTPVCSGFYATLKKSIKRSSNWSAFYFTSRKASLYSPVSNTICLYDVLKDLPKNNKLLIEG